MGGHPGYEIRVGNQLVGAYVNSKNHVVIPSYTPKEMEIEQAEALIQVLQRSVDRAKMGQMCVAELIRELHKHPQGAPVLLTFDDEHGSQHTQSIDSVSTSNGFILINSQE